MHELSIAEEIVNIISQSVEEKDAGLIKYVFVKVGRLSNVVVESLKFNFEIIVQDTAFRKAELKIDEIPISVWCNDCNSKSLLPGIDFFCPLCNSASIRVVDGDGLYVDKIELINS